MYVCSQTLSFMLVLRFGRWVSRRLSWRRHSAVSLPLTTAAKSLMMCQNIAILMGFRITMTEMKEEISKLKNEKENLYCNEIKITLRIYRTLFNDY